MKVALSLRAISLAVLVGSAISFAPSLTLAQQESKPEPAVAGSAGTGGSTADDDQSAQEAIEQAKEATNEAIETAKQAILAAIERAKEIASSALETEKDVTERALDEASEATKTLDKASEAARDVLEKAKQATSEVLEAAKKAAQPSTEMTNEQSGQLSDADVENLVERSYQYVAMYNVNNKFALKQGGWNTCDADTELKDHTMREIARPNNDTLYISCLLDLRKDPVILEMPAFDSDYVSLMVTGYDHYVNVPKSTRLDDFEKPEKMLFYSARTEGYDGEPVEGVDDIFEASGDFISAVLRIMPHAKDEARFERIVGQMQQVKAVTLSEFRGQAAKPIDDIAFPPVGEKDADVFGDNLLEVMQFVFNHTTFDPNDALDRELLAAYEPLGVVPGQPYDAAKVAKIDGAKVRAVSERIFSEEMAKASDAAFHQKERFDKFKPKGEMPLELLLFQSVIGPIGLPAVEAVYPAVTTADGSPINAMNDYVIRMSADEMPPTDVFWSMTLYDLSNGFFIPNDRKKYSVGENAGMQLDENGGIEVYVAAEKPEGVPEENWLPINRKDEDMDIVLRIYEADLDKMRTWEAPKAEKVSP